MVSGYRDKEMYHEGTLSGGLKCSVCHNIPNLLSSPVSTIISFNYFQTIIGKDPS